VYAGGFDESGHGACVHEARTRLEPAARLEAFSSRARGPAAEAGRPCGRRTGDPVPRAPASRGSPAQRRGPAPHLVHARIRPATAA
jgi:hypothetical protein